MQHAMDCPCTLKKQPSKASYIRHSALIVLVLSSMYSIAAGRLFNYRRNETDRQALLEFKAQLSAPSKALSSWNNTLHFCQWRGVACGRRHRRVRQLELAELKLQGPLSPFVGNLTFLFSLNVGQNYFFGQIPPQIVQLPRLWFLNLSFNSFQGEIPPNMSESHSLGVVHLANNRLEGEISSRLSLLPVLLFLGLSFNHLTGKIPDSFGNFSVNFYHLSIAGNNLHGKIPDSLGRIPKLYFLQLSDNHLSGEIPPPIYNLSSLGYIHMTANGLNGSLPSDIAVHLPNLVSILLGGNQFTGPIPASIANVSQLRFLDFGHNSLVGSVPRHFGRLKNLFLFSIANNSLGSSGQSSNDLDFITSLVNCTSLVRLFLADNHFGGHLPLSISNLSNSLTWLSLGGNMIYGSFPRGISEKYPSLMIFDVGHNLLAGSIPSSISRLQHLQGLYLQENELHGEIPLSLGNITSLVVLSLEGNSLRGTIPQSFGSLTYLQQLDLSANHLSGTLPRQLLLPSLLYLNLSSNLLNGILPPGNWDKMKNLVELDISGNKFNGEIPTTIGECSMLGTLHLEKNMFQGPVPQSLIDLKDIRVLNLAHNNLTGQIPAFLGKLKLLEDLDLSFNDFIGEVPKEGVFTNTSAVSIRGNNRLCGGIRRLNLTMCRIKDTKRHNRFHHPPVAVIVVPGIIGAFIVLSFCLYGAYRCLRKSEQTSLHSTNPLMVPFPMISYSELFRATNGFSSTHLIGSGTYGSVYKGFLGGNHEETIAVKVFNIQYKGASKSFNAECKLLNNIRHRNLLKIKTACSSIDFEGEEFKALVFDYMPNGNLDQWLHPTGSDYFPRLRRLNLLQRLNIAIDVACALDYLHSDCLEEPIVHRDLKPSNVLLDADMVAHVGDFGLSKFLHGKAQNTTSTLGIGTVGYAAPEYGLGGEASTDGDIYSYGILLLEMLTEVRPTDERLKDHLDLHQFAKSNAQPEQALKIIDPSLLYEAGEMHEILNHEAELQMCIFSMLEIGVNCSKPSPRERKKMKDVLTELRHTRERYTSHGIGN